MKQEAPTGSAPQDQRQPEASAAPILTKAAALGALDWLCQELRNQALFLRGLDLAAGSALNMDLLTAFAAEMRKAAETAKRFTDFAINTGADAIALAAAQWIEDEAAETFEAMKPLLTAKDNGSFASTPEAEDLILFYFRNFGVILANRRALLQWLKIEAPHLLTEASATGSAADTASDEEAQQISPTGSAPEGSAPSLGNGEASATPVRSADTASQPTGLAPADQPAQPIAQQWGTAKAKKLLAAAVEAGLCQESGSGKYKWLGSATLYAYFVIMVSDHLDLRSGNNRLPWAKFSALFDYPFKLQSAIHAASGFTTQSLNEPEGWEAVKDLCRE